MSAMNGRKALRVLVVAGFDSTNAVLARCAHALISRGHEVVVVSSEPADTMNNVLFTEAGLEVESLEDARERLLDYVDVVLAAPLKPRAYDALYADIRARNLLVFSFATLFSSVSMHVEPDFVFAAGEGVVEEFNANGLEYRFIKAGNPQYDGLVELKRERSQRAPSAIKNVLVVDQGGYPYGSEGKCQLAQTLIKLAEDNPTVEFDVRPRYVPGRQGRALHPLSEHIFDFLEDAPANLHKLVDGAVLEDVLPSYDAMITMWSTAYLAALALDMPLLLLHGFDSVDVFDVRTQRVEDAFAHLGQTGCLLHYSQARGDVGRLFKKVDPQFAERELYNYNEPCSERIVSFIELAFATLEGFGLRVEGSFQLTPEEYCEAFTSLRLADADDPAHRARAAYERAYNAEMQAYVHLNRCMGRVLDMAPLMRYRDGRALALEEPVDETVAIEAMREALAREYRALKDEYFQSEAGKAAARSNVVMQDHYFDWLYESGRVSAIEDDAVTPLLVPETRAYYLARIALDRHDYRTAHTQLYEFLRITSTREVVQVQKCRKLIESLRPFKVIPFGAMVLVRLLTPKGRRFLSMLSSYRSGSVAGGVLRFLKRS